MSQYNTKDIGFDERSLITADILTGVDASQAVTINAKRGRVTSSTTTLAADTVETITVTCAYSETTSTIIANVRGGGAAAGALSVNANPSAANGSFTLSVRNNTSATAADAAYVVDFVIINDNA